MKRIEYAIKGLRAPFFKLIYATRPHFDCPICQYSGPFMHKKERLYAKCPQCGEVERARLQSLVLSDLMSNFEANKKSVLHIAPENAFRKALKNKFKEYTSADLTRKDVDFNFDIQKIPFDDATFDLVFASHVLEYPENDLHALSEISRVLKNNGAAILPVPLIHHNTIDLTLRDPSSHMMHEPGLDYFERMRTVFTKVEIYYSEDFKKNYQLMTYRGKNCSYPLKKDNGWYSDIVPVCYK